MSAVSKKRSRDPVLFIVNDNIKKEQAYFGSRSEQLRRIAHGVYISQDASFEEVFKTYGLRLARKFFPNAALTHVTARYRVPVGPIGEPADRVFVGGDYPYKKILDVDGFEARIVQSTVNPDYKDKRLYEKVTLSDPIGEFEMWCATPELILLQQMDATKVNPEKHLPDAEVRAIWREVKAKYQGRGHAWDVLEKVAKAADKLNEANRFFTKYYREDD
jgi:hypothetical protein